MNSQTNLFSQVALQALDGICHLWTFPPLLMPTGTAHCTGLCFLPLYSPSGHSPGSFLLCFPSPVSYPQPQLVSFSPLHLGLNPPSPAKELGQTPPLPKATGTNSPSYSIHRIKKGSAEEGIQLQPQPARLAAGMEGFCRKPESQRNKASRQNWGRMWRRLQASQFSDSGEERG